MQKIGRETLDKLETLVKENEILEGIRKIIIILCSLTFFIPYFLSYFIDYNEWVKLPFMLVAVSLIHFYMNTEMLPRYFIFHLNKFANFRVTNFIYYFCIILDAMIWLYTLTTFK